MIKKNLWIISNRSKYSYNKIINYIKNQLNKYRHNLSSMSKSSKMTKNFLTRTKIN